MAFSKFRDDMTDELEDQVARLQKEVKVLRKALGKRTAAAYDDGRDVAADVYEEIASRLSDAMPVLRERSRVVRRAASDHPVTAAVVGLALVGLLVGLMSSRR